MNRKMFTVSAPPFWHCGNTVPKMMLNYVIALLPAAVLSVVYFKLGALRVIALSCFTAMVAEALAQKVMKRPVTLYDLSALLTGLLFAFLLPASSPWWMVIVGATAAIVVGKQFFGGLGGNPLPACLVGWAVLKLSWAVEMGFDESMLGTAMTYPLNAIKQFGTAALANYSYGDLLVGNQLGGLGAVQILALLVGGVYLIARGYLKPHIPIAFLASVFVFAGLFYLGNRERFADPVFHLLTGSVILGAFFIANEGSSSPVNRIAMVLYGVLAGFLVVIIRSLGIWPDGVPFAILLASLVAPLLDRIRPKIFGKA